MPVYPLLQLRCCLLFFCAMSAFAPLALIGDFGARGTGEVIEDGRLETTPEPGHDVLARLVDDRLDRRVRAGCSQHWRLRNTADRHWAVIMTLQGLIIDGPSMLLEWPDAYTAPG